MTQPLFHLAFPVANLDDTKAFYVDGLGCETGRETPGCIILNLQGHQIVAHMAPGLDLKPQGSIYPRHFGLIFEQEADWENLLNRAQQQQLRFYQKPKVRFLGSILEHRTFFLEDPFYNILEFKFYRHPESIFGAKDQQQVGDRP